jgi:hypothetical protein
MILVCVLETLLGAFLMLIAITLISFKNSKKRENLAKTPWICDLAVSLLALAALVQLLDLIYCCSQYSATAVQIFIAALCVFPVMCLQKEWLLSFLLIIVYFVMRKKQKKSGTMPVEEDASKRARRHFIYFISTFFIGVVAIAGMHFAMAGREFSAYIYALITWLIVGGILYLACFRRKKKED